jgi:hypothetical protein
VIFVNITRTPEIIVIVEMAITYFCTVGKINDNIPFLLFGLKIKIIKKVIPHHKAPEIKCTKLRKNWNILSKY